ncbi:MAG: thiol protease/hemagglutinin PrtT [Bacteroidales bacterium]|nr:thiol protease/hemagglutinin PrtT [Bacteroidales bacterium]
MKKLSLLGLVLALCINVALAAPIDVNLAKNYGQKYVQNTLGQKSATLALAYTQTTERGVDALYIFNYDHGYVVVAADDCAHPILGYSEDAPFDVNNIPEGLRYYLGYYARQIQYALDNNLEADAGIAEQWYLLGKEGVISRTRMEKAVDPLLTTTWDQGWPYNYYAPACTSYWTNNHCYAGCVACSMSQVMKFWNWPETGVGEHSYSTSTYGGTLSANFGATTYNWAIMPNSLGSQANVAAQAVALLMYHCGIAVDMDFQPGGSGAHTEDVAPALIDYFRYGACANMKSRDSYTRTSWEDMLIESFDRGIPVVYAGSDSEGGHAFNCDGYNNQRYFHFNWGWSGSYNNYYQIDALNTGNGTFNEYQRVVFNIMPDYIYTALVPAIETMTVDVADAITKTAVINWTVPTQSVSGDDLEAIQQIILKRNGEVIQTYDNPMPGETVTFEDVVPQYGEYQYTIVGKNNGFLGNEFSQSVLVGPTCTWKFVCQTTNFQGWNGGALQVVGPNGMVFKEITMTSSSPLSEKVEFPEGEISLRWVATPTEVNSITISLKNSANQQVYNFTGPSTQLNGTLYTGTNDCPNCTAPTEFTGEFAYDGHISGALLTWNCEYAPSKFKVYRSEDGIDYEEIGNVGGDVHEYFDPFDDATYYYKVTAFSSACESNPALTMEDTDYLMVTIPNVTAVAENELAARIYPNPTTGSLNIEADALVSVTVYNLVGQKVYEANAEGGKNVIDMKSFGCGMYLVKVASANGSITRKVTVIE